MKRGASRVILRAPSALNQPDLEGHMVRHDKMHQQAVAWVFLRVEHFGVDEPSDAEALFSREGFVEGGEVSLHEGVILGEVFQLLEGRFRLDEEVDHRFVGLVVFCEQGF